jgi:hypothetical protein
MLDVEMDPQHSLLSVFGPALSNGELTDIPPSSASVTLRHSASLPYQIPLPILQH